MNPLNSLFSKTGFSVARNVTVKRAATYPFLRQNFLRTLSDYEKLLRATVLPELPARENRHELMLNLVGNPVLEAFYILHALHLSLKVPGDVCEFGVAEGTNSALLANELLDKSQTLWLFDSFEGLPKPTAKDKMLHDIFGLGEMRHYEGKMAHPEESVRERLSAIHFPSSRTQIVPGFIERVPDTAYPQQICFAYVDFDFYEPIQVALEKIESRLSVGGYIVVDDYGFFSEGAQLAVDEFCVARQATFEKVLPDPAATGFAILQKTS